MLTTVEVTNKLAFVDFHDELDRIDVCGEFQDVVIDHGTASCKMFQLVKGRVTDLIVMEGGKALIESGVAKNVTVQESGELLVLNLFISDSVVIESQGRLLTTWTVLNQMKNTITLRPGAFVLCNGISTRVRDIDTVDSILEYFKSCNLRVSGSTTFQPQPNKDE